MANHRVKLGVLLPRTRKSKVKRIAIRIPEPMLAEIDRIINAFPEFNFNRQQFVETAIREKMTHIKELEAGAKGDCLPNGSTESV